MTALLSAIKTAAGVSNAFDKSITIRTSEVSTTVDTRPELEERWRLAGAQLEAAQRHVEVGIGQLFRLLPAGLGDPFDLVQTIVERWITETIFDLRCSAREGALPGGAR